MVPRLPILFLSLAAAAPAGAQPDPGRAPVAALTPAQNARVDSLAADALAAFEALPADKRAAAAYALVNNLVLLRRCSLADPVLRANPHAARGIAILPHPDMVDSEPACTDRLITLYAETLRPGATERDSWDLYTAAGLWRRIGQDDKAEAAIAEAERRFAAQEASSTRDAWACHGGYCLTGPWSTRLWALQLTRGTPQHREDLRWAGTLALSHAYARDARRPGPYIGQAVFEELLPMAVEAGDDTLARLIAEKTTYGYPAAAAGHRMRRLLERGKVAEALELWPTAGGAFQAPITPVLFRAHLPLFHRWREQLRTRHWRGPGELMSLLAAVWVERGEPERAREALATARAHHASVKGYDWELQYVQRLLAVEAMLEGGGDPVGWLGRRNFPARGPSLERDHAFRELAALLAATNRQAETRRALAAIRDPGMRRSMLVELPCRAAYGGDDAAGFAVRLGRGRLRPNDRAKEEVSEFETSADRTFLCLIRAHRGEAATAYVQGLDGEDLKLNLLTRMPLDSGIPNESALRLRLAGLALEIVEARNLWADPKVPYIAADFERAGDFERVERVLARIRDSDIRMEAYDRLLRVYGPYP